MWMPYTTTALNSLHMQKLGKAVPFLIKQLKLFESRDGKVMKIDKCPTKSVFATARSEVKRK